MCLLTADYHLPSINLQANWYYTKEKGEATMGKLNLTAPEEDELLLILERYLPDLESEIANTDSKEFRKELKNREVFMKDFIARLKR